MDKLRNSSSFVISLIPSGVVCYESALALYGLCSYDNSCVHMFKMDSLNDFGYVKYHESKLKSDNGIIKFNENLYITSVERTICEMIINCRSENYIIEGVSNYLKHPKFDKVRLHYYSKLFNIQDRLMYYINIAEKSI